MRLARAGVRNPTWRIVLAVLPVLALAAGCQGSGPGGSGAGGPLTVAVVPGIDNAPLRVAVQEGLFRQRGLDVTIKDYPSLTAEVQALTSGQARIAAGDYTGFFYTQATGRASLRLVADGHDASSDSLAILTLPGSGITTPQQLAGQPGGVATLPAGVMPYSATIPYDIQTLAAEEVLQNDGVSPSSVTWTQVPAKDMIGALRSGRVKAILATEPYILQAEEQLGAVEVVNASSGVTSGLPLSGYFSLSSYGRAHSAALQAFREALDQAQSDSAQRGLVQAVLPRLTGMSRTDAAQVTLGTYPASLNVGQVQRVATLMYDSAMIRNPVSASALAG
ncbi:MAG TPA: ABC transporter substrate-binding protein [Streptosporangiaceae bacterium]|jgi:NitT/TauT family transport system substrate-binding protein